MASNETPPPVVVPSHPPSGIPSHPRPGVYPPPPPGVYVPVPTFFVSSEDLMYDDVAPLIDVRTQALHAVHLAKSGIRGIVMLGSTGEAVALTNNERFHVISAARQALKEAGFINYPIIAGTASQSIQETVIQLKGAESAFAQWGLCLAPGYFAGAVTQEGLRKWYLAVADRSPIPIMIYHYPGVSNNVKLLPSTIEALAKHDNIVGCKLSHGDLSYHIQIAANPKIDKRHFHTFTGLGQQLVPVMSIGCAGTIDGLAGFFPRLMVYLYSLSIMENPSHDQIQIRRFMQFKISSAEEFVVKYGTVGIKEAISRLLGFGDRDGTRLPLCGGIPGGDKEWENWKGLMEELKELEEKRPLKKKWYN